MSRGKQDFKQRDLTKAIKGAVNAGVTDWRVEIANGKIVVSGSNKRLEPGDEAGAHEWD